MYLHCCFGFLLILSGCLPEAALAAPPENQVGFVKGFSWGWLGHRGEYRGSAPEQSMEQLAATGTQWIALAFAAHVETSASTEILYGEENRSMVSDEEVRRAVSLARRHSMKIMMKPTINSRDGQWRALIDFESEDDWRTWWDNYEAFLLHYAKMAAQTKCELFCVGCEMRSMERFSDRWRRLIARVREVYPGTVVYNVNHDDIHDIEWFDAVDMIGVSAYYPVATEHDTSLERMMEEWKPVRKELEEISQRWNRPILFAEIGVCSAKACSVTPWASARAAAPYDGEEQARFYEAAFRSFFEEPWFAGFFWWDWKARLYDREKAAGRSDFSIYGKPAEQVVRRWYAKDR